MTFGKNLNQIMRERGFSQARLAFELESKGYRVSTHTLYSWINDSRKPRLDHVHALAKALDCNAADLVAYEPEPVGTGTEG